MQSSLAIVLSLTSGSSPCPCVSIFGTGPSRYARSFSWKTSQSFSVLAAAFRMRHALASCAADLPAARLLRLPRLFRQPVAPAVSVTPSLSMGYGNLHPSSIGYAFRPLLRSRLSQSGRTFLWKPWAIGAWDSHPRLATHAGILSSMRSSRPLGRASSPHGTLPYHSFESIASVSCLAPVNYRRRVIRLVSCYALFEGWLLLSQPPSCLHVSTSFST